MADAVCLWSSLPGHLLEEIAIRTLIVPTLAESVEDFRDFMAFRKVCTVWRAAATKDLFVANYSRASQLPYLMLPEKEGSDEREFYSVFTGKISGKVSLPEVSGKRCIEARFGWLLTLAYSGEVQLFNPISRSCIHIPNFKKSHGFFKKLKPPYLVFRRAVLSANPSETSDFVLAVRSNYNMMEFWRNGDENWSITDKPYDDVDAILDIMYSERDKIFYGVCGSGLIYGWDPSGIKIDKLSRVCCWHTGIRSGNVHGYLMESASGEDGDILLVSRNGTINKDGHYGATIFRVFRINLKANTMEQVQRLKDEAIFVGHNAAICFPTSKFAGLVRSSCIYFSDDAIDAYRLPQKEGNDDDENKEEGDEDEDEDEEEEGDEDEEEEEEGDEDDEEEDEEEGDEENRKEMEFFWGGGSFDSTKGGGKDMGIYNLEDGSIERFDEYAEALSSVCPAVWITPPSLISLARSMT